MAQPPQLRYRAWDRKDRKMRTVLTVSLEDGYVTCKDRPGEKVSLDGIELLRHMGITGSNRKAIFEGDIVLFREGDSIRIGTVAGTGKGEWIIQLPRTGEDIPFPWNRRDIEVLGNKFENEFYLSDEYARVVRIDHITDVLSSPDICMDKYCRHDLERAVEGLSGLSKEELIEMVKSLSDSLRYYKEAYFEECSRNRRK